MIALEHVSKRYPGSDVHTIRDAQYTFNSTGLYFLTGKSGSGKSTLLNMIGGMDRDYEGRIIVDDIDLGGLDEIQAADYRYEKISFVFQDCSSKENETVRENLLQVLAIASLSEEEKSELIQKRTEEVGLVDKLDSPFKNLSGGEKKRLALAKGLVKDAPILLADEPLASLNKNMRRDITDLLKKEAQRRAVIVITHEEDEIPPEAGLLRIINGRLIISKEPKMNSGKQMIAPIRRRWSKLDQFKQILHSLRAKRQLLSICIISLVIALFSITFSFLLSSGVKNSFESMITTYMSNNSLVISNRDESYSGTAFQSADLHFLNLLERRYPDIVASVSNFYLTSLDDIFKNDQRITALYKDNSYTLDRLSMNAFAEAKSLEELPNETVIYGSTDLDESEVILGLREEEIAGIHLLIYGTTLQNFDEDVLSQIGYQLSNKVISLRVNAGRGDWSYYLDHSFRLKGFFLSDSTCVLHTDSDFNSYFVNRILQFKEILVEEEYDESVPWTLRYVPGLRLHLGQTENFLAAFLEDADCDPYVPQLLTSGSHYVQRDIMTHNRIVVYKDHLPKLTIDKISDYVSRHESEITEVMYSSPIYTCTASGYISGFQKTFFFSANLEELNHIQDTYHLSDVDLGAFQGSLMEVNDKVIKADLLSALDEDGLRFRSSSSAEMKIGHLPKTYQEIAISEGLAERLFGGTERAMDRVLHALTLVSTEESESGYVNTFAEGELTIVGVVEDEDNSICHDALFPICYAFSHLELEPEEVRINQAVIAVDLEAHESEYYLNDLEEMDLRGSFPIGTMLEEIEETLDSLSLLFLAFATLGLLISCFLLFLALYLIINKDRRATGIMLALGYQKREISEYYLLMSLSIGIISYLLSVLLSVITEFLLRGALEDILTSYSVSFFPYLISLLTALVSTGMTGIVMRLRIDKLSPTDIFHKR